LTTNQPFGELSSFDEDKSVNGKLKDLDRKLEKVEGLINQLDQGVGTYDEAIQKI
jgi:hypothetical protein